MMAKEVTISNYKELMTFIKRDDVPFDFASEVVQKFLKVLIIFDTDKDTLIKDTQIHIDLFWQLDVDAEHPIFLHQEELRCM